MRSRLGLALVFAGIVGLCGSVGGLNARPAPVAPDESKPSTTADEKVPTFKADVMPILKTSCVGCHGAGKKKGGVDVSSYESVMKTVKANDADKSKLVKSVLGQGAKLMPPKNGLPEAQVAILKAWIAAGAKND
ncbi:MAG: hypothetical protein K8U57_10485 [Planctomycetes bacterium]|nr:hypothetical protein [Planctomycetota bacterium]